jgi:hypothetical protein
LRDLTAGALARRDIAGAIQLLEQEKERGFVNINDVFLLIYLYCLKWKRRSSRGPRHRRGVIDRKK